jgi:hypothetical protein
MTKPHVHIHLYDKLCTEQDDEFAAYQIWEQHDVYDSVDAAEQGITHPQYFYTTNQADINTTIEVHVLEDEYVDYHQFSVTIEDRVIEFRVMKEGS